MIDKEKTAIQWLIEQTRTPAWRSLKRGDIIEQAKAIERKQTIDFHIEAMKVGLKVDGSEWSELYLPKITEVAEKVFTSTFITD